MLVVKSSCIVPGNSAVHVFPPFLCNVRVVPVTKLISMNGFLMEGPGACAACIQMEAEVVRWGLIFAGCRNVFGVSSENSSVMH